MSEHLKSFLVGGVGGILPKSLTLAILLTNSPTAQLDGKIVGSFYVGLALFFLIGGVIALFVVEKRRKLVDYLFAGIAAPSLIVSIGAGMNESNQQAFANLLVRSATAAEQSAPQTENKTYNYVITSLPRGDQPWRKSTLTYDIIVTDTQGKQSKVAISWPNPTQTIHSDAPIANIEMQDERGQTINSLTLDQHASGELIVQPAVESQLDFLWILGAKGKAKVVNCAMRFVPDKS